MTFSSIRLSWYSRFISFCVMIAFVMTMVITPKTSYAQEGVSGLPQPGEMVNLSPAYVPLMITGLTIHPENPLLMDFIVSTGNSGMDAVQVKKESDRLIKYFLACLTIPENHQWVNLSPYEKQRIVPEDLGQTVLGQDMLAQDYLLKQLTASLIYPEKNLGKNFWDKVYAQARQEYGTTQIPVNTFNKVWILPDTATVYEHKDTALLVKSHLKVMLDEDYLALSKHTSSLRGAEGDAAISERTTNDLGSKIVRQIILPAIEQEVNNGKNFAQIRQIYHSMILAVWFKNNLKQALLSQVYADKSKVNGVNVNDPSLNQKIYDQYLQAYKRGVFNYIKEDVDPASQQVIPRKYFSGGLVGPNAAMIHTETSFQSGDEQGLQGNTFRVNGSVRNAVMLAASAVKVTEKVRYSDRFVPADADKFLESLNYLLKQLKSQDYVFSFLTRPYLRVLNRGSQNPRDGDFYKTQLAQDVLYEMVSRIKGLEYVYRFHKPLDGDVWGVYEFQGSDTVGFRFKLWSPQWNTKFNLIAVAGLLEHWVDSLRIELERSGDSVVDLKTLLDRTAPKQVSNAAMTADEAKQLGFSTIVQENIEAGVIATEKEQAVLRLLSEVGEQDLLNGWAAPGVNDQRKREMLEQIADINAYVAGGFAQYKKTALDYFDILKHDKNPFEGARAEVPEDIDLTDPTSPKFEYYSKAGMENVDKLAFMLAAGGMGERLGALGRKLSQRGGTKVQIQVNPAAEQIYLANYAANILAMQDVYNKYRPANRQIRIPFFIMVSDETYDQTIRIFAENNNFGFAGISIDPTPEQIARGELNQVIIARQKSVPTMRNSLAKFTTVPGDPYRLETKPHNHVDVHRLLDQTGVAKYWESIGKTTYIYIQDTNAQGFNAIPAFAGVTIENNLDGNILTVNRRPGDKVGCVVKMVKDGIAQTYNVEYNQIAGVLKSMGFTEADFTDKQGNSLFPGNTNVLAFKASTYNEILSQTGGSFSEMLNLKDADLKALKAAQDGQVVEFGIHPRLEAMIQDWFKELGVKKVASTKVSNQVGFMATKNGFENALIAVARGNMPESLPWAQGGYYRHQRFLLAQAGVNIDVEGQERFAFEGDYQVDMGGGKMKNVKGIPFQEGAYVNLPFMLPFHAKDAFINGGSVTSRSFLLVNGPGNVIFDNLQLDGTLIVNAVKGVRVVLKNLTVKNQGWQRVFLTANEVNDPNTPIQEAMQGYRFVKSADTKVVNITKPGNYEIGSDGELKEVNQAMTVLEATQELKDIWKEVNVPGTSNLKVALSFMNGNPKSPLLAMKDRDVKKAGPGSDAKSYLEISILNAQAANSKKHIVEPQADAVMEILKFVQDTDRTNLNNAMTVVNFMEGNSRVQVPLEIRHTLDQVKRKSQRQDRLNEIARKSKRSWKGAHNDAASLATPGGIDLNAKNLKMQSSGEKVNITFDPALIAQFKRGDFSGVRFEILDVVPVNLMPLLGLQ